jgi:hypothetical protein
MPTLRSHTHLQATYSQAQTKACKRVCLPNRTIDRQLDDRKEQRRHNSGFAKKRVQWLIEHSASHQILWYVDSLVHRNPLLRKAANRQAVKKPLFSFVLSNSTIFKTDFRCLFAF